MNIQFDLGFQDRKERVVYSNYFPDNINLSIGELINLDGFFPLFTKGALYLPEENNDVYMDLDDMHGVIGEITELLHTFVKDVGYVLVVAINTNL
jgi:hypothetical protein